MRIISGALKGRVINAPKNLPVRPTTDFAKESLFNILSNNFNFDELDILDLFCGTGSITYEFLSRGCISVTSVDENFHCCEFVKKTSQALKLKSVKVIKANAFSVLKKGTKKYDIVFCDPPYELPTIDNLPNLVFEHHLLKLNGWLIVEHGQQSDFSNHIYFREHRKYGNVNFSFFYH